MKKILLSTSLLASMCAPLMAGEVVTLAPCPTTVDTTPINSTCTLWEAFKAKPQAFEISAVNAISSESEVPNIWGPRFAWSMYTPSATNDQLTHEFNLGVSFLWGEDGNTDMFEMPVAVGYNAVYALGSNWDVYAGTKLSLSYVEIEDSTTVNAGSLYGISVKDKNALFGLSLVLGTRYNFGENLYASFAYEYKYTFANVSDNGSDFGVSTDDIQSQHVLSLGVGYKF